MIKKFAIFTLVSVFLFSNVAIASLNNLDGSNLLRPLSVAERRHPDESINNPKQTQISGRKIEMIKEKLMDFVARKLKDGIDEGHLAAVVRDIWPPELGEASVARAANFIDSVKRQMASPKIETKPTTVALQEDLEEDRGPVVLFAEHVMTSIQDGGNTRPIRKMVAHITRKTRKEGGMGGLYMRLFNLALSDVLELETLERAYLKQPDRFIEIMRDICNGSLYIPALPYTLKILSLFYPYDVAMIRRDFVNDPLSLRDLHAESDEEFRSHVIQNAVANLQRHRVTLEELEKFRRHYGQDSDIGFTMATSARQELIRNIIISAFVDRLKDYPRTSWSYGEDYIHIRSEVNHFLSYVMFPAIWQQMMRPPKAAKTRPQKPNRALLNTI